MLRETVYQALDSEREYQNSFVKNMNYNTYHEVSEELLIMLDYFHEARHNWVHHKGKTDLEYLNFLRKVAATGIRCFENHGVPHRNKVGSFESNSMPREDVYKAVDSERDYQDSFVVEKEYENKPSSGSEFVMVEEYLARARKEWTDNKGDTSCLDVMRKVVGICVRCFENHGVPFRVTSQTITL